ncbi:Uncharacterised protein [Enterobacter cloacae]|nr:Uncharacterised protein [Enterobacter cloacae]
MGIDLQFKHTDQITADRLNSFKDGFLDMGFFACWRN